MSDLDDEIEAVRAAAGDDVWEPVGNYIDFLQERRRALTADLEQAREFTKRDRERADELLATLARYERDLGKVKQEHDEARRDIGRLVDACEETGICKLCDEIVNDDRSLGGHASWCAVAKIGATTPTAADPRDAVVEAAREFLELPVLDASSSEDDHIEELAALFKLGAAVLLLDAAATPARGDSECDHCNGSGAEIPPGCAGSGIDCCHCHGTGVRAVRVNS